MATQDDSSDFGDELLECLGYESQSEQGHDASAHHDGDSPAHTEGSGPHHDPASVEGAEAGQSAKRQAPTPSESPSACPLTQLSEELLLRVMCFLSPEDLCTLGGVSRLFHCAASDGSLWRRLYFARWPKGPKNEEQDLDEATGIDWKVEYMERDHQELSEALHSAPPPLKPLFAQLATARRSESLGLAHAEHLFRLRPPRTPRRSGGGAGARGGGRSGAAGASGAGAPSHHELMEEIGESINTFRRQRGLTDASLHGTHCCGGGECRGFTHLGANVWICATTGYVHRCGENCKEREVDGRGGPDVCHISGRCFDRMMSEDEEEGQVQERGGEEARGEEEWQADEGISGRLGRAFYAGYNASDERDLLMYGIKWS